MFRYFFKLGLIVAFEFGIVIGLYKEIKKETIGCKAIISIKIYNISLQILLYEEDAYGLSLKSA
jgi:hypothetical protein